MNPVGLWQNHQLPILLVYSRYEGVSVGLQYRSKSSLFVFWLKMTQVSQKTFFSLENSAVNLMVGCNSLISLMKDSYLVRPTVQIRKMSSINLTYNSGASVCGCMG